MVKQKILKRRAKKIRLETILVDQIDEKHRGGVTRGCWRRSHQRKKEIYWLENRRFLSDEGSVSILGAFKLGKKTLRESATQPVLG